MLTGIWFDSFSWITGYNANGKEGSKQVQIAAVHSAKTGSNRQ